MFWKTMGIIWTVLLLVAVALLWQLQRPRAGSGAAGTIEQGQPPRGTQVTAFVVEVPAKYMSLAPDLVHMRSVRGRALMQPEIMKWPRSFRQKVLLEPRKYYSVRFVGPKESGILAIDARACESIAQADQLVEAVAEAFISQVQSWERMKLDDRIKHAHSSLRELLKKMDGHQTEIAGLRAGSGFIGKGDNLAFHEARLVSERLIDARLRLDRAEARLIAAQAAARGPRPAPSSKPAEPVVGPGRPSTMAARISALKQALDEATEEVASLEERKKKLQFICSDVTRKSSLILANERQLTTDRQSCAKLEALLLELRLERRLLDLAPRLIGTMLAK